MVAVARQWKAAVANGTGRQRAAGREREHGGGGPQVVAAR